ncbi:MAG: FG-GAP repeat domain-containing protein, partial [Limisphaerales bacterium]
MKTLTWLARVLAILALSLTSHAQEPLKLLNIDFGAGTASQKVGPAATGQSLTDFWNFYTRDDGQGGFRFDGLLGNLKWADGASSGVELAVTNAAGAWSNGATDPMFAIYLYPLPNGNGDITLYLHGVPAGRYDLYLYGHGLTDAENGVFQVKSGDIELGTKAVGTEPNWNVGYWTEDVHYVLFRDLTCDGSGALSVTVKPSAKGEAILNGLQLFQKNPIPPSPAKLLHLVADGAMAGQSGNWQGIAWGDYDNDGRPDLFVSNYGGQNR